MYNVKKFLIFVWYLTAVFCTLYYVKEIRSFIVGLVFLLSHMTPYIMLPRTLLLKV